MRLPSLLPILASGAVLSLLAPAPAAQLTDLQPGRNFTSVNNFGTGRSENIDPGDVDNDGDLDVGVANGGDGAAQDNYIFINNGGLQGGTVGTFSDQSSTRFAGIVADTSRDIEFVDVDNDNDLDIYISNRGSTVNGGEPSRFYTNLGGLQGGTIGFYSDQSNVHWGNLVSVPIGDQVLGGNQGPFRDFTCDCDFADLDDDGDTDLFHSSYGPNIDGTRDSRIFLNDGTGVFNELWPWANATADTKTHTIDLDLVDFDGDFDIDVFMSSRNSQARTYCNNLYNPVGGGAPFADVTQPALLAQGIVQQGANNYEAEYGDVDGDGDFDVYIKNFVNGGLGDTILRNDGTSGPGTTYRFSMHTNWIKGDPNVDENEIDFIDYDNDGDLDAFVANFSGTNTLYQSGAAQGLNFETQGLLHRTGIAGGGSLAGSFGELPTNFNGGTSLDGDIADMDNDGDLDILLSNDANQQNRLFVNQLGVPDTHAPTFALLTTQGDKANGSDTVIHAAVRDNVAYYLVNFYPTNLVYTVNGGSPVSVPMFHQGSQQFRGVIPAQNNATIDWHVECTDLAGNTGTSGDFTFVQGSVGSSWTNLGGGLAGVSGIPSLVGSGLLSAGQPNTLTVTNAAPSAAAILWLSFADNPSPFKGGTLHTVPIVFQLPLVTNGVGANILPFNWPTGVPSAFDLYFQVGVQDAAAIKGVSLSNYIRGTTL